MSAADPVALLAELLRAPSVTPDVAPALDALEGVLKPAGFAVERPVFREAGTPDVENLFAAIGTGDRHFTFGGHVDVVPTGAESLWSRGPFSGAVVGDLIYGRGAADMKGGVAAFAAAALDFVAERGPDFGGRLSFLITGDEEGPSINGTVKLLAWAAGRGERFTASIVGEPTSISSLGDMVKVGRRGSLTGELTLHGTQGHVAYPHRADNPLRALPAVIAALVHPPLDAGNERFQPSNLEVTTVDTGNLASNVIPAETRLVFNVRFNDEWTVEKLEAEIAGRIERAMGVDPLRVGRNAPLPYTLVFEPTNAVSFLTRSDELIGTLSEAIRAETGLVPELSTTGGTSDARFIKDYCPVVEFGPVGQTMHKVDECVSVSDLLRLKAIYRRFLDVFFPA
jgi:succinyl-diaminopimelate desuccinylase